ncbi:MAG: hypothetical protein ACE5JG_03395, partial [Planctomycetota bacterium]
VILMASLSSAIVYTSTAHHLHAQQAADRARALALAEGAASLLLVELSDDAVAPVKNAAAYTVDGSTYTRTYEPFEPGDGTARIEVTYLAEDQGLFNPVVFADRADPTEPYGRVRAVVTGVRPRAERTLEIELDQAFVLFRGAIVSDSLGIGGGSGKGLAQNGHIVFEDEGRPGQLYVNGDLMANGGVYYNDTTNPVTTGQANNYITFAGTVSPDLAGSPEEIPDYTAPGSTDQLFDFARFIAAARTGAGREFTNLTDFVAAMNAANGADRVLEGITVLSVDPAVEGKNPKIEMAPGPLGIPGGINVRGTLLFNFAPGTDPFYKVFIKTPLNINGADLGGLNVLDPTTYASGYLAPWNDPALRPSAVDISGGGFANFAESDDLPALMFNTGIVDIHHATNVCGLVYGPSFIEIENKDGQLQYFNGAILGGAGILVQGHAGAGSTVVNFDAATINLLATQAGKGRGLRILSWRTVR